MKYKIGDVVYWINASCDYQKRILCTMCFGKRYVTIVLGDDSKVESMCGFCERGLEPATGITTIWEPSVHVEAVSIQGISTRDGTRYEIGYRTVREDELYASKEEADVACTEALKQVTEQAAQQYREHFKHATKKQIWSAGYHRECIKSNERSIEWHKLRLRLISERKTHNNTPGGEMTDKKGAGS